MSWYESLILGLVQGASEFLPISSSGHLLLLEKLGIGTENMFFNIMLHVGTLLAVLIALRKDWIPLLKHPLQKKTLYLAIACVPTVILALVFKFCFPTLLNGAYLALGFMLTSCLLIASEYLKPAETRLYDAKTSVLTGVFQGIAVLPGVSRSGATIAAMRLCGIDKEEACSYSFLLSIPIILSSALFEGASMAIERVPVSVDALTLIIGMSAAFLSGLIAVKFFLRLFKKHSMAGFAVYTFIMSVLTLVLTGIGF